MPGEMPITRPVDRPIKATVVVLLLQVPPEVESYKNVGNPKHFVVLPVMGEGKGFTVTTAVL